MLKEWSNLNKQFQNNISKEISFKQGINDLLELRKQMYDMVMQVENGFPLVGYYQQPFINSKGYDAKTMAYSIYHISRIEDIVCHTLICQDEQIFYQNNYQSLMHSPIQTTGNELVKEEIGEFSKQLDIEYVFNYFKQVYETSNEIIEKLAFHDLKRKVNNKEDLIKLNCVSYDENAFWLIDYWCSKDILGLLKMPFSRHWIMHIEAFLRIKNELIKREKKKS